MVYANVSIPHGHKPIGEYTIGTNGSHMWFMPMVAMGEGVVLPLTASAAALAKACLWESPRVSQFQEPGQAENASLRIHDS